jgi:hypothetical protein
MTHAVRLSAEDLRACRLRERQHFNGRPTWFGYGYVCVEHPRLRRLDRYDCATKAVASEWSVDGAVVPDLAAAAEALNRPPVLTDDEAAALAMIGTEYADHRKEVARELLWALDMKGQIEWGRPGQCRRRPT